MHDLNFEFTPEFCYILGFLWGDGYVTNNKERWCYLVGFEIVREDFEEIFPIFELFSKWNVRNRFRTGRRESVTSTICGRDFVEFLEQYNYSSKDLDATILNAIPNHLKNYWLRGLIDADGSISFKSQSTGGGKYKSCGICLYGPINQDWSSIISLFNSIGVFPKIKKRIRNTGKSSELTCFDRKQVILAGKYIYDGLQFGLTRKKKIMEQIYSYDLLFLGKPARTARI